MKLFLIQLVLSCVVCRHIGMKDISNLADISSCPAFVHNVRMRQKLFLEDSSVVYDELCEDKENHIVS